MLLRHTRKSSVLQMAAPNLETGVPRETRQGHLAGTCHWNHLAAALIISLTDWSTKSWLRNELDELWRSTLFGGSTLLGIYFHEPLCPHSRDKREIHSPWFLQGEERRDMDMPNIFVYPSFKGKDRTNVHQLPERRSSFAGGFPARLSVLHLTPGKLK